MLHFHTSWTIKLLLFLLCLKHTFCCEWGVSKTHFKLGSKWVIWLLQSFVISCLLWATKTIGILTTLLGAVCRCDLVIGSHIITDDVSVTKGFCFESVWKCFAFFVLQKERVFDWWNFIVSTLTWIWINMVLSLENLFEISSSKR